MLASLDVQGVSRRFSGVSGLLAHREVRDLLSLLRVIADPSRSEDVYAVLTAAPYGLSGADLTAICGTASRRRRPLWSVVTELVEQPGLLRLSEDTRARLQRVVADISRSISIAHEQAAPAVLYEHLRVSGWLTPREERYTSYECTQSNQVSCFGQTSKHWTHCPLTTPAGTARATECRSHQARRPRTNLRCST